MDNVLQVSTTAADPTNRWRFSGKEEQPMMGDNLQDFGARFYDSRLAR